MVHATFEANVDIKYQPHPYIRGLEHYTKHYAAPVYSGEGYENITRKALRFSSMRDLALDRRQGPEKCTENTY